MTRHDEENQILPSLRGEVESFFSQVLGARAGRVVPAGFWNPRLDVAESPERFVLEMDLPGVRPEDLRIEVQGRQLVISGSREIVRESGGPSFRLRERSSGSFRRAVELPADVDRAAIESTLREGILRVELPRRRGER